MTITSRQVVARILRAEAESIQRHGFTEFFGHNFNCLQAQVLRTETCEGCLLREYVPEEYRTEAFPCQHMDVNGFRRIASDPELPEKVAARLLSIAEELETAAKREGVGEINKTATDTRTFAEDRKSEVSPGGGSRAAAEPRS